MAGDAGHSAVVEAAYGRLNNKNYKYLNFFAHIFLFYNKNMKTIQTKQTKQTNIDINCDLGQSYGVYKSGFESELVPYVSSVSIACGLHAGDPLTIMNVLQNIPSAVSVGAHVGYPDIQGFGYRSMQLNEKEMEAIVVYQIGALNSLARLSNRKAEFVRPHGALYKQISEDYNTCLSFAKAISDYDPWLVLVGPPGENLIKAGEEANIRVCPEIQLDKKYNVDGSIDFNAGDVINFNYSINMLEALLKDSQVPNNQGGKTRIEFNSIHLSMKNQLSLQIAKRVRELIPQPVPVSGTFVAESGWLQ